MEKVLSLKEAIAEHLEDGMSLTIEGFTHLICFAAGHEIIRQKNKNLCLARLTPDLVFDQLIEADCARKLIFSWAGNPGVGSLHAFRRKIEAKESTFEIEEYSHFGMVGRLSAGAKGLPFWPLRSYHATDLVKANQKIKEIECPYTGEKLATVPALNPDLAIIHVQRADKEGNAQVWGLMGTQVESAFASKKVIIVCEEIVDSSVIRQDPNRTLIPGFLVSAVVEENFACHPSYVQGYYDRDNDFYISWDKISRDPKTYQDYLDEFVFGVQDRSEYIKKMNSSLMKKLAASSKISQGVNYGY